MFSEELLLNGRIFPVKNGTVAAVIIIIIVTEMSTSIKVNPPFENPYLFIFKDTKSQIWISIKNKGLVLINPKTYEQKHFHRRKAYSFWVTCLQVH